MRDWGNNLIGTGVNGNRRLWVAAIDPNIGTADPSHPAFYLEGQENNTPNMRAFWVNNVCLETGEVCSANFECCSGFCVNGKCGGITTLKCVGSGDTCTTAADCCNQALTQCTNGKCKVIPAVK
jgi:hypothetical protein